MAQSVSVIIPTIGPASELASCLESLQTQTVQHKVHVVDGGSSDGSFQLAQKYSSYVYRVSGSPSERRNFASDHSTDGLLAFLDSDAVAPPNWVASALPFFDDPSVGAVLGPNLTPANTPMKSRVGSDVLGSFLGGGLARGRWSPHETRLTDERDSMLVNMFIRKSVFDQVGQFHRFFGGEENDLIARVRQAGFNVIYSKDTVVFHKRVPLFRSFAKQVIVYGRGRAVVPLSRSHPFYYLPPALICSALALLVFAPIWGLSLVGLYAAAVLFSSDLLFRQNYQSQKTSILERIGTFGYLICGHFVTHISYSIGFLYGLFKPNTGKGRGR